MTSEAPTRADIDSLIARLDKARTESVYASPNVRATMLDAAAMLRSLAALTVPPPREPLSRSVRVYPAFSIAAEGGGGMATTEDELLALIITGLRQSPGAEVLVQEESSGQVSALAQQYAHAAQQPPAPPQKMPQFAQDQTELDVLCRDLNRDDLVPTSAAHVRGRAIAMLRLQARALAKYRTPVSSTELAKLITQPPAPLTVPREPTITVARAAMIALEQRCERGTPWDLACTTIAEKLRADAAQQPPAPLNSDEFADYTHPLNVVKTMTAGDDALADADKLHSIAQEVLTATAVSGVQLMTFATALDAGAARIESLSAQLASAVAAANRVEQERAELKSALASARADAAAATKALRFARGLLERAYNVHGVKFTEFYDSGMFDSIDAAIDSAGAKTGEGNG